MYTLFCHLRITLLIYLILVEPTLFLETAMNCSQVTTYPPVPTSQSRLSEYEG